MQTTTTQPPEGVTAPAGFREVSKDEFYATVGKLNVHPDAQRERSVWKMVNGSQVVGYSYPGYMCVGPTAYFVKQTAQADGSAAL